MSVTIKKIVRFSFFLSFFVGANLALAAYPVEKISLDPAKQDFVVGPGKQEFVLSPGETIETEIIVSNRMGEERTFNVGVEDFKGSRDPNQTVIFLGKDDSSPFSLKKYLKFENKSFTLQNGYRARIPVTVKIPDNAEPGGKYGVLFVSTVKPYEERTGENGVKGGIPIEIRSGVLFFVRVPGDVKEDGRLADFKILNSKPVYGSGEEINFQLLFENNGSIHLDPYGTLSISNISGQEVKKTEIDPWFSMPDSLRSREISITTDSLVGRYTAKVNVYRGYGDPSDPVSYDEKTLTFWVVPWSKIFYLFVIIFIVILVFKWFRKNFEFKRKPDATPPEPPKQVNS